VSISNTLTDFFLHYKLEKGELVSGNIWGTSPGRSFRFNLETHKFFDFSNKEHCGRGIKKLFELRNEQLPSSFRSNYRSFQNNQRKDDGADRNTPYKERLDVIPDFLTPPNKILLWEGDKKTEIPARAYAYKNTFGERVGYIMRATHPETQEKIIRPLSVWTRLRPDGRLVPSYRMKKFPPFLYNYDLIVAQPEKIVVVVEGEKCAEYGMQKGAVQYGLPIIFTTWPFGSESYGTDPVLWNCLLKREKVVLWPDNDEPGKRVMTEIKSRFLPQAKLVKPEKIGLQEKEDIADLPVGPDFERLLRNLVRAFEI